MVGLDGQFAVTTVDENRQPDGAGAAEILQGVHGSRDGAARVKHIVDEHHRGSVDGRRHTRTPDRPRGVAAQVVAVQGDVELAHGHVGPFGRGDQGAEPLGQGRPTGRNSEQDQVVGAAVRLDDLGGDAAQGP